MRATLAVWAAWAWVASGHAPAWWDAGVEATLVAAGEHRAELEKALRTVAPERREGMAFLLRYLPPQDRTLKAEFLLENVDLAYAARAKTAWGKDLPDDLFLNDVLPYASVTETREPWRRALMGRCLPWVQGCKTPGEAAQALHEKLFAAVKVRYSTSRNRPDQSPSESIATGIASCTGLSILLIDACRSVGVPARIVGIPKWTHKPGNHMWVEVWDGTTWRFTGACEFNQAGLDKTWFVGDAAQAKKDSVLNAIYASSYRKTDVRFPLVWAPGHRDVFAVNVTDRYAKPKTDAARLMVRVWSPGKKERAALPVQVALEGGKTLAGQSRSETADLNDILTFDVPRGAVAQVRVADGPAQRVELGERETFVVDVVASGLAPADRARVVAAAKAYFDDGKAPDASLDVLTKTHESAVRAAVWEAYASAKRHADAREDFAKKRVRFEKHLSEYTVKHVGKKPAGGWGLAIAMHGGGGAPKPVNDSQWAIMQQYYRDQPEGGYVYVALRAPNDVWNGFYDEYVPPLVANLIGQFALFGEVDVDRVMLLGYSHGGYGAFYIGPKTPDRFAAVHASAAAPTDGTISAKSLRNTRFTFMIGERDTMYGRRERCEKFAAEIETLRKENPGEFPAAMEFQKGFGHGGLPDRDKIKDMLPHRRNPTPRRLTWELTDARFRDFFWASVDAPARGLSLDASVSDNRVSLTTTKIEALTLWLDGRSVALDRPLTLSVNGKTSTVTPAPRLATLCESMARRADPSLAASWRIDVRCAP